MLSYDEVSEAASYLAAKISQPPTLGVVLGTGLGDAVDSMQVESIIPYDEVPHMRPSTNPYHKGQFVLGMLHGQPTICMQGRIHIYEGYTADQVAFPVFVMKLMGVQRLILTNSAGAINTELSVGQFALITDHINYMGQNPLPLLLDSRLGNPCPDMTSAYSPRMRQATLRAAQAQGENLGQGVYIGVPGPSFETPAEIRAFRAWGADLVGMSTVCEAIAARSCGIELFGVSLVTNMAAGIENKAITAEDIANIGDDVPLRLANIIEWALS